MAYLKFFRAILLGFLLGCILFLVAFCYQIGTPTQSSQVLYNIYKVKIQIANSIKKPKLIPISGSNSLAGISCKMIHEQTGVPCVNGGTHAGLGVDYLLSAYRALVKPGDLVLLPLEYDNYYYSIGHKLLVDYVFARDINYFLSADLLT